MLVNPLHACAPTHPVENSPYYPASRRFSSPLYLRPERLAEYAVADEAHPGACRRPAPGLSRERASSSTGMACGPPSGPRSNRCSTSGSSGPAPNAAPACGTSRPGAPWPNGTARTGGSGRSRCTTRGGPRWRARGRSSPGASPSTNGSSIAARTSSPTPSWPRSTPAWRSVSCTTSPSAWTPAARTPVPCRTTWPPTSASARRRTTSTSSGRTGGCRRGGPTGCPKPATRRCATWCGQCWPAAAGCAWTT